MKCEAEECSSEAAIGKVCSMHYQRMRRHGSYDNARQPLCVEICIIDDCTDRAKYNPGYCQNHYNMIKRYGRTYRINNKGYTINSAGYILVYHNGVQRFEHVILAEKALGKPLPIKAEVHHMNGVKHDNHTPYNLVICPNRAYHMLLHRRAKELGYEIN